MNITGWRGRFRNRPTVYCASASALYVREFLGNQTVANANDVDASNVPVGPRVSPQLNYPVIHGEGLFGVESARRVIEDRRPGTSDRVASLVPRPVRRGVRVVEDAVLSDECDRAVQVVVGPRLPKCRDHLYRRRSGTGHFA